MGMLPEFVSAVDGCKHATRLSRLISKSKLSAGEVALTLSHRKAWRKLLTTKDPYAIVLEDDARISKQFKTFSTFDWTCVGFDIIKLETFNKTFISRKWYRCGLWRLHRLADEHYGTAGYLISRQEAVKALSIRRGLRGAIDSVIFGRGVISRGALKVYQVVPAVVVQDEKLPTEFGRRLFASTIEGERAFINTKNRKMKSRGLARWEPKIRGTWRRLRMLFTGMKRASIP